MDQGSILIAFCLVMVTLFFVQTIKPGQWRIPKIVVITLIIGAFVAYVAHMHHREYVKAQEEARRRAEFEVRVAHFVESHNAVRDWEKQLEPKVRLFSADLGPVLVREDRRPIFSIVSVEDVSASEGGYTINFTEDGHFWPDLKLHLNCSSEQASVAMSDRFPGARYALVAKISSVGSEDRGADGTAYIGATGNCIDVMRWEE